MACNSVDDDDDMDLMESPFTVELGTYFCIITTIILLYLQYWLQDNVIDLHVLSLTFLDADLQPIMTRHRRQLDSEESNRVTVDRENLFEDLWSSSKSPNSTLSFP